MIAGLAFAVMLFVSDFNDTVSCVVQGYVYRLSVAEPLEFSRADSCSGVKVERDAQSLTLYSPHIWVNIIVPADKGHRRFQYRWGANVAHIGTDTVPVYWGRVQESEKQEKG